MSRAVSFVRMYPSDWRSGCLGLSLEQEGLYIRACMFIAETGKRVPLDDSYAARILNVNINQYRKVLGQLLMKGKIKRHDDGYGNDRAESEHEKAKLAYSKSAGSSEVVADWKADQGQVGGDNEVTTQVTTQVTTHVTPPVEAEKTQCFLRATKEPEPELEKVSVCVSDEEARLPVGFEPLGHGALINCETIRHPNFAISIVAVKMELALQCPGIDARQVCSSAALQWAAEIEGGKSPREVVPSNIRGAIVAGARMGHFRTLEHETRSAKATAGPPATAKRIDFASERIERAKALMIKTSGGVQ